MNKLEHLKAVKDFFRKIIRYRNILLNNKQSGRPDSVELAMAMFELKYQAGSIVSFDQMMQYISQQQKRNMVFKIIPSNKHAWREEFDRFVYLGMVLQGKIAHEKQLQIF